MSLKLTKLLEDLSTAPCINYSVLFGFRMYYIALCLITFPVLNTERFPGQDHFSYQKETQWPMCPQVGVREFSDKRKRKCFTWKCVF